MSRFSLIPERTIQRRSRGNPRRILRNSSWAVRSNREGIPVILVSTRIARNVLINDCRPFACIQKPLLEHYPQAIRITDRLSGSSRRPCSLVEVRGSGLSDQGCSYGSYGSAYVTKERLADIVENRRVLSA